MEHFLVLSTTRELSMCDEKKLMLRRSYLLLVSMMLTRALADCFHYRDGTKLPEDIKVVNGHLSIPSRWTFIPMSIFSHCASLKTLYTGDNVTDIQYGAFYSNNIEEITFGSKLSSIKRHAFSYGSKLKHVTFPDSFYEIDDYAFQSNSALETVTLGRSEQLRPIYFHRGSFGSSSSLKSIAFGQSLHRVDNGEGAFSDSHALDTFIYFGPGIPRLKGFTCTLPRVQCPSSRNGYPILPNIRNLTITETVTDLTYDGRYGPDTTFTHLSGLTKLDIALSNSTTALRIGTGSFNIKTLTDISIGRANISLVYCDTESLSSDYPFINVDLVESIRFNRDLTVTREGFTTEMMAMAVFGELICDVERKVACGCFPGNGSSLPYTSPYFNCKPCPPGSYSNTSRQVCSPCPSSAFSREKGTIECTSCALLEVKQDGANVCGHVCPSGKYVTSNTVDCQKCAPGRYSDKNGVDACQLCPPGTFSSLPGGNSSISCHTCEAGKYNSQSGMTSCVTCPVGKFRFNQDATQCLVCPSGRYGDATGISQCQACPPGKFGRAGSTICTSCPLNLTTVEGRGRIEEDCFKRCGIGEASLGSQTSCFPCNAGTFNNQSGESQCSPCPLGRFTRHPGKSRCTKCSEGSYTDTLGSPTCTLCPGGTYGKAAEAKSKLAGCGMCQKGKFSFSGSTMCREAPPGSYVNITGATDSTPCAAGRYQEESDQTSCNITLPGRYAKKGSAVSILCSPGKYCQAPEAQTEDSCLVCPLGKHSVLNRTVCESCGKGTYSDDSAGSSACLSCPRGTYLDQFGGNASTLCKDCEAGKYAPQKGSDTCLLCGKDTYTASAGKHTNCTDCPFGKTTDAEGVDGGNTGATTCVDADIPCDRGEYRVKKSGECVECEAGYYSPSGTGCLSCPPGSFCPTKGMVSPKECPVGHYTDTKLRHNCTACPAGQYQSDIASAKCFFCPAGKFLDGEGANSSSLCLSCSAGTYGDKTGLPACSQCPTGQVQPGQGQTSCKECTLEGKIKTNNAARTLCIDDEALLSSSVMESMFTKGVGLSLSFGMAGLFVGLAGAIHFMKSGYSATVEAGHRLGALGPPQVVLKSALPGFSFGSEVVLIIGMMTEAPKFGWALLAFRLLHPCTMIVLTFAMTVPNSAPAVVQRMMRKSPLSKEFSRRKVPLLCVLYLASVCDVTMLQLMPWVDSEFYTESMGYPSLDLMLVCMVVKTVQALVSVVCQGLFLWYNSDLNDPLMSFQAKILFGFSITLSGISLVMGVMTLLAKWSLLRDLHEKDAEGEGQTTSTSHTPSASAGIPEVGDLYGNNSAGEEVGGITSFHNPMHAAAMEENASLKEELQAKDRELEAQNIELEEQRRENEQLRLQQQSVLNL